MIVLFPTRREKYVVQDKIINNMKKTPLQCVGGENAAQVREYLIAKGAR